MASFNGSAIFTPAAASHLANDVVGGARSFGQLDAETNWIITSASLMIADATVVASGWRLYLFNVTPPSALADDAAFSLAAGDRASFVGTIDLGNTLDFGDTQYIEVSGINKHMHVNTGQLYGYLVNLTTITPPAVAHTVILNAVGL